ncbi:MAG TPA: DUF5777 family beta-barrel protein [Thermoanaerobaculia bacterium]|jgi:hypothetical protein|nr:DUF5777 family beta-barrel protein [Thermoanaerobaculia bacterium]
MINARLAAVLAIAFPLFTFAQGRLPVGDQLLTLPSSHMGAHGTWELKFTHRFNQSLADGSFADQLHSLFGLDTNADVTFGLAYAIRPDLQLSIARSNTNDTFEAAAKYLVLEQAATVPLTIAVRGGVDFRTERDLEDRSSLFAQAILSRRMGKVEVFAMPTYVTNAGRTVTGDTSGALFEHAFNVPVGVAYFIKPPLALVMEIIPPNGDLPDETNGDFGWSVGIKRAIGGHWFELLLTNSQGTTVDQYTTSTFQGAGLDAGEVKLGFNIERRFGRRRR